MQTYNHKQPRNLSKDDVKKKKDADNFLTRFRGWRRAHVVDTLKRTNAQ